MNEGNNMVTGCEGSPDSPDEVEVGEVWEKDNIGYKVTEVYKHKVYVERIDEIDKSDLFKYYTKIG